MDNAFAWIASIMDWLGRFIPRREILDTTQGAIKYKHGHTPVICAPGVHWYWPWTSTWVVYPTARQTDRLATQTMETTDRVTFVVDAMLTYSVHDIAALVTTTYSPTKNTVDIAMAAVHDVCCDYTWAELQDEQRRGTLKTKLKNEASRMLRDYGITVIKLQLNTLARCRVLKISQSTASEEN